MSCLQPLAAQGDRQWHQKSLLIWLIRLRESLLSVPPCRDKLPTQTTKHKDGSKTTRLTKDAFIYDKANNCYWCPNGQPLKYRTQSKRRGGLATRRQLPASAPSPHSHVLPESRAASGERE